MPNQTSYASFEPLDYTGIVVKMIKSDGFALPVTPACDFNPPADSAATEIVNVSCAMPMEPYAFDLSGGYVNNNLWIPSTRSSHNDVYQVTAGHKYFLTLNDDVGNYFNAIFTTTDVSQSSEDAVIGSIIIPRYDLTAYCNAEYTPDSDGFIIISKNKTNVSGIKTYLIDTSAEIKTLSTAFALTVRELESSPQKRHTDMKK